MSASLIYCGRWGILSGLLEAIHLLVSVEDRLANGTRFFVVGGISDGNHGQGRVFFAHEVDLTEKFLVEGLDGVRIHTVADDAELVAAGTETQAVFGEYIFDAVGGGLDAEISEGVAVPVVDAFKVVDVKNEEGDVFSAADFIQGFLICAPGEKPGQAVDLVAQLAVIDIIEAYGHGDAQPGYMQGRPQHLHGSAEQHEQKQGKQDKTVAVLIPFGGIERLKEQVERTQSICGSEHPEGFSALIHIVRAHRKNKGKYGGEEG